MSFAPASASALPLHVLRPEELEAFLSGAGKGWAGWLRASGFEAGLGELRLLPGPKGEVLGAVAGYGTAQARRRLRFGLAKVVAALPAATPCRLSPCVPLYDSTTRSRRPPVP